MSERSRSPPSPDPSGRSRGLIAVPWVAAPSVLSGPVLVDSPEAGGPARLAAPCALLVPLSAGRPVP